MTRVPAFIMGTAWGPPGKNGIRSFAYFSDDNPVAKDAIVRKLDLLRREVKGPHPTTLERLLADRMAIGWLALTIAEGTDYQALDRGSDAAEEAVYLKHVDRS